MLIFLVWLSEFIEKLNNVLSFVSLISFIVIIMSAVSYVINSNQYHNYEKFWFGESRVLLKRGFLTLSISLFLHLVVPNKNIFYAMVGVYAGQEIIASPKAQELFDKSIKVIEIKLDEVIETSKGELDKTKPFECTGFRCGKRFSETEIMGLLNDEEE